MTKAEKERKSVPLVVKLKQYTVLDLLVVTISSMLWVKCMVMETLHHTIEILAVRKDTLVLLLDSRRIITSVIKQVETHGLPQVLT